MPTAVSSPRPAHAMPSVMRSSAASHRSLRRWCAKTWASNTTTPLPTTCSAPRGISHRRRDVKQAYAVGKAAVQDGAGRRNGGHAGHQARSPTSRIAGKLNGAALPNRQQGKDAAATITSAKTGFRITEAARRYLEPLIPGEDYPPYINGLPKYVTLKNVPVEEANRQNLWYDARPSAGWSPRFPGPGAPVRHPYANKKDLTMHSHTGFFIRRERQRLILRDRETI